MTRFPFRILSRGILKKIIYLYFIIDPHFYIEDNLELIVHVDGMDVFNKTKKGFWSVMGKVFSNLYMAKPFLIALYYGNSKPYSARDFLKEFVEEVNIFSKDGIF